MVHSCAALNCKNRCSVQTRSRGVTFHCFPKDTKRKKQWESALKRKDFNASRSSMLCSEHFRWEDIDRTGQTVRIRDGAIPSVFNFPAHLQKPVATRTTLTSKKAQECPPVVCSQLVQETKPVIVPNVVSDHSYPLPASPEELRARLSEALARVRALEKEKRNAKDRERRTKKVVLGLLEDLREKNLIIEELKAQLSVKKKKSSKLIKKS
ncbi:THAP domain-containing protein 6 isoform X1 [Notolabrus celidotus]|uniref:THAP domain-containing protein 6 isoform X1 n=1 Tax=Notolabrus celidotus TaxID=1203425 RepID=UPI00148FD444|nr:THAP domain-containing protein 6 isoform X1 [Notolabrus celidotus]